jgi:hypothetical protein
MEQLKEQTVEKKKRSRNSASYKASRNAHSKKTKPRRQRARREREAREREVIDESHVIEEGDVIFLNEIELDILNEEMAGVNSLSLNPLFLEVEEKRNDACEIIEELCGEKEQFISVPFKIPLKPRFNPYNHEHYDPNAPCPTFPFPFSKIHQEC